MPWREREDFSKLMKTNPSHAKEAPEAESSAPAADRPATASDTEMPGPAVVEDPEAKVLLSEDALGNLPLPPEIVTPRLAQLETWDTPAAESGYRVAAQTPEDEAEFPEVFAEEGADEAEEEQRAMQGAEEKRLVHEEEEMDAAKEERRK